MILPLFLSSSSYLFIAIAILILSLSAILFYRIFKKEEEFEKKEENVLKDYNAVLHRARRKARDILTRATDESVRIYRQTDMTNEKIIEELDHILQESVVSHIKSFNHVSETFITEYKQAMTTMQEELIHSSQTKIERAQKESDETLNTYTSSLQKKFGSLPESFEKKIQETFSTIDKQAEEYKKMQLKKIDDSIGTIVMDTYQEILSKNITLSVHTDLVVEALEKAKKEGIFGLWQTKS